jgi:D-arabinose 1-dehydrogenase-like Zn-dependent alcohol dehydrogenase
MDAWILEESPGDYRFGQIDERPLRPDGVRVRVVASALNHMDLWVTRGMPKPRVPHVPGCDGAGVVDEVGADVEGIDTGDEVVINPAVSCRHCHTCLSGESPYCRRFQIVGEQRWGTHASFVTVPAANVSPKPADRGWDECAAFGLCALTAWRMLRRARVTAGETVLVVGVGDGRPRVRHKSGGRQAGASRRTRGRGGL